MTAITGERRLLQLCVFLAASVAVIAGGAGAFQGAHVFGIAAPPNADNHIHYIFGLLLGIGLAYWSAIPRIETRTALLNVLTFIVVCGGLSRLAALLLDDSINRWTELALANEIVVAPLLWLWQRRIARIAAQQ